MCASYEANPNDARSDLFSLFPRPDFEYRSEIYRDYSAPIFRRELPVPDGSGLVLYRAAPAHPERSERLQHDERPETLEQKRGFSGAWKNLQLCLIPCQTFFEPNSSVGVGCTARSRRAAR